MNRRHFKILLVLAVTLACLAGLITLFRPVDLPPIPPELTKDSARDVVTTVRKRMRQEVMADIKGLDVKGAFGSVADYFRYRPSRLEVIPIPGDPNPMQVLVILTRNSDSTNGIGYAVRLIDGNWTTGRSVRGRWASSVGEGNNKATTQEAAGASSGAP